MAYAIYTHYVEGGDELARKHARAHLDHLATWEERLIASGGLMDEAGALVGGCVIVAADTLSEVEAFVADDPFTRNGVIRDVEITQWIQTFLNGRADRTPFTPHDSR